MQAANALKNKRNRGGKEQVVFVVPKVSLYFLGLNQGLKDLQMRPKRRRDGPREGQDVGLVTEMIIKKIFGKNFQ